MARGWTTIPLRSISPSRSGIGVRTMPVRSQRRAVKIGGDRPVLARGAHSKPSTVRRCDRPHGLPSFVAIAGVAGVLAAGVIRDDVQAHLAVARVGEQPPSSTPTSLPVWTTSKSEAQSDVRRRLRIGVAEVEANQGGAVIARTSAVALPFRDWADDRPLSRRPVLPEIVRGAGRCRAPVFRDQIGVTEVER